MPGTPVGLSLDAQARLTRLAELNPQWGPVLGLIRETAAVRDGAGGRVRPEWRQPTSPGIPLLHTATIRVDAEWLRDSAERLGMGNRDEPELRQLIEAAVREDGASLDAAGARVATLSRYAAIPLLSSCAGNLAAEIPPAWEFGYCPLCAAWPLLAEVRGLEQSRRLRCGRCGTDWAGEWLRCIFCGETDHTKLSSLVPETRGGSWRAETCASCHGYVKTMHSLAPLGFAELHLADLETVELDLVARARGLARPSGLGFPLEIRILLTMRSVESPLLPPSP